jgi:Ino eighty subunit 1
MDDAKPSPPPPASTLGPDDSEAAQDTQDASKGAPDGGKAYYTATTTTTRRNANGSVSSVYSGNKIRHLKKDDGIPLWRKDIQYDFLRYVFEDSQKVFHKKSEPANQELFSFADIYLDAMANSSKCSKILKDKLLTERPAAVNMAMVCLLVNVGRMNTTLNCRCIRCDASTWLIVRQSSPKCAPSYGPTTRSPRSRPARTPTPTSSSKMPRASSRSSRVPPRTKNSPAQ